MLVISKPRHAPPVNDKRITTHPLLLTPPPLGGGTVTFAKTDRKYADDEFSLGDIVTAAVLVLPL